MALSLLAGASSVAGISIPVTLADVIAGGGYVSIVKAVVLIVVLLAWAWMLSWADKDAVAAHLPRYNLNLANLGGLIAVYALVFLLPISFWLILPVVLLVMAAEVAVYLHLRNKVVGLKDLRKQFEDWKKGISRAKKTDAPGAVQLMAKAGPMPVPAGDSPDRAAYDAFQIALTDPLRKGADQIDLTPAGETVAVKYLVDCVSYALPTALDAAGGQAAIAYVKGAAGLDVAEKRKPQKAKFKLTVDGEKREGEVQAAGTTAGEYLRLVFNPGKRHALKLPELGFTAGQLATLKASMSDLGGIVLLATPKGQGLTQLTYGVMRGHDAFMQHLQSIERDPPESVEGVTANPLTAAATPADELQKVDWVISQSPDVILVDKLENPKSATSLIAYAADGKRVYIGMRAGSTADAIEQWRRVSGGDAQAMAALKMVICGRVLRKLCSACKESYTPDPNTLRKLNMSPEKVTTLFKARETPLRDPKGVALPCEFCKELKFKGRTGVFEVVTVTDELRQGIAADVAAPGGRLGSNFRAAFRKGKGRYLQEEALALVEAGDTSVQEVLRVLKPAEEAAPAAPRPAAAPRAPAATRPPAARPRA
jgi:type IV pilus assembly protein PilB